MIDINELRRKLGSDDITDHVDIHANVKPTLTELLDRIEAAEKDIALKERIIDSIGLTLNAVSNERDALRAKIEEMERQEPSHWGCTVLQSDGRWKEEVSREAPPEGYFSVRDIFPLYTLPGAKGEEK